MNIFRYLSFLFFLVACFSLVTRNDAVIWFNVQEYDFGTIPLKEEVQYNFGFSNPGKTLLILSNIKPRVAAISPNGSESPPSRGKGKIKVTYDTAPPGFS